MLERTDKMNENIVIKVLKIILIVLIFPIWLPWKLLFGRKSSESPKTRKIFLNIVKSFAFILILLVEVFLAHKIRYSPLTYGFTNASVRDYYLNENRLVLDGMDEDIKDSFEKALSYIDTWDMDERNKMNVILDSNLVKNFLKYTDNKTIDYILNKFNNDSNFREDFRDFIKNIDKNLSRFFKEIPEEDMDRLNSFIAPIVSVASWAIDYAGALNIGNSVFEWEVSKHNVGEKSLSASKNDIEKSIRTGLDFNQGASLETVVGYWK